MKYRICLLVLTVLGRFFFMDPDLSGSDFGQSGSGLRKKVRSRSGKKPDLKHWVIWFRWWRAKGGVWMLHVPYWLQKTSLCNNVKHVKISLLTKKLSVNTCCRDIVGTGYLTIYCTNTLTWNCKKSVHVGHLKNTKCQPTIPWILQWMTRRIPPT